MPGRAPHRLAETAQHACLLLRAPCLVSFGLVLWLIEWQCKKVTRLEVRSMSRWLIYLSMKSGPVKD